MNSAEYSKISTTKEEVKKEKLPGKEYTIIKTLYHSEFSHICVIMENEGSPRLYALKKVLKKSEGPGKDAFVSDVKALSRLSHPNIVKISSCCQDNNHYCLLLEYMANGSLRELMESLKEMKDSFPLPMRYCLGQLFFAQIICALEYIHSEGIIHKDLKPENVLLDENYHIKVCDFGVCEFSNSGKKTGKRGTIEYASPEQLDIARGPITHATDLWSLGCMIYEFFYEVTPFAKECKEQDDELHCFGETKANILNGKFTIPSTRFPHVARLCAELLKAKSEERKGGGEFDPEIGYKELKEDEFFRDVKFETLRYRKPLVTRELLERTRKKVSDRENSVKMELNIIKCCPLSSSIMLAQDSTIKIIKS
eukprot:TRINITY_DN2678_c0_g1_i1.p1 TRINITY_DN2678_c0_g1~~TRINITY_DN2678_c0_g1_i1.p1  ORF type:complete len:367 (+),score=75.07 TRINITY_DN2678_c0_g1_i1:37-1137(+)